MKNVVTLWAGGDCMQKKKDVDPLNVFISFHFLCSLNVSLTYIWPRIDSLLFSFTGSVSPGHFQAEWITASVSQMPLACLSAEI